MYANTASASCDITVDDSPLRLPTRIIRRHDTRAPTRYAACRSSRLRPSRISFWPSLWCTS